jgi:hypothetical protein
MSSGQEPHVTGVWYLESPCLGHLPLGYSFCTIHSIAKKHRIFDSASLFGFVLRDE